MLPKACKVKHTIMERYINIYKYEHLDYCDILDILFSFHEIRMYALKSLIFETFRKTLCSSAFMYFYLLKHMKKIEKKDTIRIGFNVIKVSN